MKFLKLSEHFDFVFWGGLYKVGGKDVRLRKRANAQFPIESFLGETSVFPRYMVYDIEDNLLKDNCNMQVCLVLHIL